jgi:hypothetical protein
VAQEMMEIYEISGDPIDVCRCWMKSVVFIAHLAAVELHYYYK